MQDVFLHLVRNILPPTHFILVETLACVCRDFTQFPAEFCRANNIDIGGVDLDDLPIHGTGSRKRKVYCTAYGRVMTTVDSFGNTCVLKTAGVSVMDSAYYSRTDITIAVKQKRLVLIKFRATQTDNVLVIHSNAVSEFANELTLRKFEIVKSTMGKYKWRLRDVSIKAIARELMKLEM